MDLKQRFIDHIQSSNREILNARRRGGTRKITDLRFEYCRDPSHGPPTMQVFDNGVYEHTCPSCGSSTTFVVSKPTL